eukprot:364181-Chlamydomonas_euryale.AAC.6
MAAAVAVAHRSQSLLSRDASATPHGPSNSGVYAVGNSASNPMDSDRPRQRIRVHFYVTPRASPRAFRGAASARRAPAIALGGGNPRRKHQP